MTYAELTIEDFIDRVAAERITPAGGSVAAVTGAMGASLCEMVCVHTAAREEADGAADLATSREELREDRRQLLELADADAAVIEDVFGASGGDPAEADQKRAITVPMTVAETCLSILEGAAAVAERATQPVLTDLATGVLLAHSALRAAVATARANLDDVGDEAFVTDIERQATDLEAAGAAARDRVLAESGVDA